MTGEPEPPPPEREGAWTPERKTTARSGAGLGCLMAALVIPVLLSAFLFLATDDWTAAVSALALSSFCVLWISVFTNPLRRSSREHHRRSGPPPDRSVSP